MRVTLRNDQATRGLGKLPPHYKTHSRGVTIQVLGAGSVFYATERSILENTDSAGTPTGGGLLTSANGPQFFQQWPDELWLRASAIGVQVEISVLGVL